MSSIRAGFDLAHTSLPVLLIGVVALTDRIELEAHRRISDLCSAQNPEASFDVLAQYGRLDFFDAHEVLLEQGTETLDALFEFFERDFYLARVHGYESFPRCSMTQCLTGG